MEDHPLAFFFLLFALLFLEVWAHFEDNRIARRAVEVVDSVQSAKRQVPFPLSNVSFSVKSLCASWLSLLSF